VAEVGFEFGTVVADFSVADRLEESRIIESGEGVIGGIGGIIDPFSIGGGIVAPVAGLGANEIKPGTGILVPKDFGEPLVIAPIETEGKGQEFGVLEGFADVHEFGPGFGGLEAEFVKDILVVEPADLNRVGTEDVEFAAGVAFPLADEVVIFGPGVCGIGIDRLRVVAEIDVAVVAFAVISGDDVGSGISGSELGIEPGHVGACAEGSSFEFDDDFDIGLNLVVGVDEGGKTAAVFGVAEDADDDGAIVHDAIREHLAPRRRCAKGESYDGECESFLQLYHAEHTYPFISFFSRGMCGSRRACRVRRPY